MSRARVRGWMPSALWVLFAALWPRPCAAQTAVGVDLSAARASPQPWGLAIDLRAGTRFGLPRSFIVHSLIIQPEVIVGQRIFAAWSDHPVDVERLGAGLRLGWLFSYVEPFAFAHASAAFGPHGDGTLFDYGFALDARFPHGTLGIHFIRERLTIVDGSARPCLFGLHYETRGFWL
jgi:hypothetical protein